MFLYGLTLCPLTALLRKEVPEALQPWYADDSAAVGPMESIAKVTTLLLKHGVHRGYYVEPSKSIVVCRPDQREKAEVLLSQYDD